MEIVMTWISAALCMFLGAGLIIVEVFLPGVGLPGISGFILCALGIAVVGLNYGMVIAVGVLLIFVALLAILISWILRVAAKSKTMQSELFLNDHEELHEHSDMQVLVGKRGVANGTLRPAGIGDFDGVRLNVVSEGTFVENGSPIEIIGVEGSRIVVRESV